jgi:hypothetical protein
MHHINNFHLQQPHQNNHSSRKFRQSGILSNNLLDFSFYNVLHWDIQKNVIVCSGMEWDVDVFASIISAKGNESKEQFEWTILMLIVNQLCGF